MKTKLLGVVCVLSLGIGLAGLKAETAKQDFQISASLQERAEFFSSHDRHLVFRLYTQMGVERLRDQQAGNGNSAYSLDLVVGPDGIIREFAINRFEGSSVFRIDHDSERLRFLRLREARSVFGDLNIVSDAISTTSDFVYHYVTNLEDTDSRRQNLRILRAIGAFREPSAGLKAKDSTRTSEETTASKERSSSSSESSTASQAADSSQPDSAKSSAQAGKIDHLEFLEDLDRDLQAEEKPSREYQTADTESDMDKL